MIKISARLKFIGTNNFDAGKTVSLHIHSCSEIVLYIGANGKTEINGKTFNIKNGDIAVINPLSPHSEQHLEKCRLIYFGIESDDGMPLPDEGVYSKVAGFERLQNIAERICTEVKNQDIAHELMASALIVEFVVLFERNLHKSATSDRSLEYCADFFRENYALQLNIREIAESYGFDYEQFRKDFKQEFGVAPKQFIVEQRLNNAYTMLFEGGYSCTDVAMFCGFSDGSQFSKMFKKRYGVSPAKLNIKKSS